MRTERLENGAKPIVRADAGALEKTKTTAAKLRVPDHLPNVGAKDVDGLRNKKTRHLAPIEIGAGAEAYADGVKFFYEVVIPAIKDAKKAKQRPAIVFDIDNTLFDTRYRTLAAAHAFGKAHGIPALENATIAQIGCEAVDTCANVGILDKDTRDAFFAFWLDFFWNPDHFAIDGRIEQTIKMLQDAKDAGAEIFYLTGRIERSRDKTREQIAQLPDGDDAHLVMKPRLGVRTDRFKAKRLRERLGTKPPVTIVGFVSEGRRDIRHIQKNTKVKVVWFDFPVDREKNPLARGTPAVPWIEPDRTLRGGEREPGEDAAHDRLGH